MTTMKRLIKILRPLVSTSSSPALSHTRGLKTMDQTSLPEGEEVHIPTPWGHIAGRWWGSRLNKPLLALHGWQDNANTFKPLVPHLPPDVSLLAIDFPGHGMSSRYPPGMIYYLPDHTVNIRRVVKHFGWKTVSLLGHSMGGIAAFMYSACFPEEVNMLAQIDILKPITARKPDSIDKFAKSIDAFIMIDKRNVCTLEPPSYTPEDMVDRLHNGSSKSIVREYCPLMLERGSARSARDPSKYFFTRDYRITLNAHLGLSDDDVRAMAVRITCPMLTVRFTGGSYFEPKDKFYEIADMIKRNNKNFELHEVPGTHHGHLQNAHLVAPILNKYIEKYHKS